MNLPQHQQFKNFDQRLNSPFIMNPSRFESGSVGGWVELARTTLGSAASTLSVSSLPDKRYYMTLLDAQSGVNAEPTLRINSDSESNYARRVNNDGTPASASSATGIDNYNQSLNTREGFTLGYWSNLSAEEKLGQHWWLTNKNGTGSGFAPARQTGVAKWANTTNAIDEFTVLDTTGDNFSSGTEFVILGWDEDDVVTRGFWELLKTVNGDGTGGFSTGTITAKKYLWIQAYCEPSSSSFGNFRFNSDSDSNYATRKSDNGAADVTSIDVSSWDVTTTQTTPFFINAFIINNSANEKLGFANTVMQNTSGVANAINRTERFGKWANTSSQITDIEIRPSAGNYSSTSIMNVWGSN